MEPGEVMSPREQAASQQALWPLFVVACGLSGFGFYEALSAPRPLEGVSSGWSPVEVRVRLPEGVDSGAGVRRFATEGDATAEWTYALEQRVGEGARETQIGFRALEEREGGEARWSVRDVRVRARVVGEEVAGEVSARLEESLEGASASGRVSERGVLEVREWGAQAGGDRGGDARALMGEAMEMLRPRSRAGEVRPGERWSYAIGLPGGPPVGGASVKGEVRVSSTFAGTWEHEGRTYVVIARRFEVDARGGSERGGERVRYELVGGGEGVAYLDEEGGEVWRSEVSLAVELRARGEAQEPEVERREIRMKMERVGPGSPAGG